VGTVRLADARKVPSHGNKGPDRKLFDSPVMGTVVVKAGASTSDADRLRTRCRKQVKKKRECKSHGGDVIVSGSNSSGRT
jgi:hypothetical protein